MEPIVTNDKTRDLRSITSGVGLQGPRQIQFRDGDRGTVQSQDFLIVVSGLLSR